MTDQPEPQDLRWLLEPPQPGQMRVHIAMGEGTEVTPEVQEAIERLVQALATDEAEGYDWRCPSYQCNINPCFIHCSPYQCPSDICRYRVCYIGTSAQLR